MRRKVAAAKLFGRNRSKQKKVMELYEFCLKAPVGCGSISISPDS
jgi:hypothetical protein